MIFGIPGSGKSTFALRLSKQFHLPLYHLDRFFFLSGWKERETGEFLNIQKELVQQDAWVIDGNATRSLEMRFQRADTVLYFRLNRLLCLWRLFKRLFSKDKQISDRAEGCSEKLRFCLIRYLWGFDRRVRKSIEILRMKYPFVQFFEFHTQREANLFLESFLDQK